MSIDNIKSEWENTEAKLRSQNDIKKFNDNTAETLGNKYPPIGLETNTKSMLVKMVKKLLIGAGVLVIAWALNYGVSSAIIEHYYQKKRNHYYESNFDYKRVEEWDKQIKYWKTNAIFPYANKLELFKEKQ